MCFYKKWLSLPPLADRNDFFGDIFDPAKDELYLKYSVQSLAMEQREYWDNEAPDDGTTTAEWEEIIREYVTFRVYEEFQNDKAE